MIDLSTVDKSQVLLITLPMAEMHEVTHWNVLNGKEPSSTLLVAALLFLQLVTSLVFGGIALRKICQRFKWQSLKELFHLYIMKLIFLAS